jgi:hypothetical protein
MAEYRPQCSKCKVYPAGANAPTGLCFRCQREKAQTDEELERQQAAKDPQPMVPRASVAACSSCLTTLHVRDVDRQTNLGLCVACKAKRQRRAPSLAASYGQHVAKPQDPNKIY